MSIYATILDFSHYPHSEDSDNAPFGYQGSHVLPAETDARDGSFTVSMVPSFVIREGRDEGQVLNDWLRLSLSPSEHLATRSIILNRAQVERLYRVLGEWLSRGPDE